MKKIFSAFALAALSLAAVLVFSALSQAQSPSVPGQPASLLPNLNTLTPAEKAARWKLLFDGKTTADWRNFGKPAITGGWRVIDGALCRVDKSAGDIITTGQYDNFILELDYKVPPHANSGIMYRVSEDVARAPFTGVEFQILDNTDPKGDSQKSGWAYALYQPPTDPKTGKPLDATRPVGEWNHVKLVCNGPHVEHWMNGVKYCEYEIGSDDWNQRVAKSKFAAWPKFAKNAGGHIALQGDHGDVCFTNIKLLPLSRPSKSTGKSSDSSRWEGEIGVFEKADRANPPTQQAVLFVGSSTIRLWKTLATDFPEHKVINRGFGGCEIADCTYYADRIVIPYNPRLIVLRAGGNDINAGKTPERVADDFRAFVEKVRAKLPKVRIAYMTINATPSRWAKVEREKKANQLIKDYIGQGENLDYIDTFDATMGSDGKPRVELFAKDRLHFNADGYKILADCVRSHLGAAPGESRAKEPAAASVVETRTQTNRMVEITLTASQDYRDAFHEVTLDALFETPAGRTLKVPAFWAGGRVWKIRYSSPAVGTHRWRSVCSVPADRGLHAVTGTVTVEAYRGENPLFLHGPIRVAADRRHFEHSDGTPFFWLADTWWMGLCQRLHWPDEFQQLAADRKAKGFNVVQIVAGLYPDMPAFDPRGANEAGFPWEKDYARIRPEYFEKADQRLLYLVDQGFSPCIVGAWGYHLPWVGTERMKEHWRYLVARYAALPVVWCAAGEGTMPFYGSKRAGEEAAMQKQGWSDVIRCIRATDPFGRMITIHPSRSARETVTDPAILDFDMHQTGHAPESAIGRMAQQMHWAYEAKPVMPVIAGESSYDGLDLREWGGGVLSSDASRQMFWTGLMHNGAAGGTYGANGLWQLNRRDAPYGPSPHGRSWGSTPWDEAMRRPGSTQVGIAKQFFAHYPWQHFEPRPGAATWGDQEPVKDDIRPCAVGLEKKLLIAYVPRPRPIVVTQLAPQADYAAEIFDPVAGERSSLGTIKSDDKGTWQASVPVFKHDWVIVLEKKGSN